MVASIVATSAVDTEVPTKTWRIIVGRTATGKSRYAAKYVAAQGHGVQVLEDLFDENIADKLSNVRLDVQEVVLVTNGPEAAHKLAHMLRAEHPCVAEAHTCLLVAIGKSGSLGVFRTKGFVKRATCTIRLYSKHVSNQQHTLNNRFGSS